MPNYKSLKAFTLTELIIVITVLAILSTIAFVSYTSNISSTRDNKRILDIDTIKIALSQYKDKYGKYPLPWDYFNITYSGAVVATQWVINKEVTLSTLELIPTDPLDNHFYSYWVTLDQKQYQLATTLENDWEEKTLLAWDYQSVAKRILPNILLATSTWAWVNIEIGSWILNWDTNRKLFLFNEINDNLLHSFEWWWVSKSNGEIFQNLLTKSEEIDYWQKHDYTSCNEIFYAWKSIGPGQYQIMNDSWNLIDTYCWMNNTCSASQHLAWWVCVINTRTCNLSHWSWTQTWDSWTNSWIPNPCVVTACDPGFLPAWWACLPICAAWGEAPCIVQ